MAPGGLPKVQAKGAEVKATLLFCDEAGSSLKDGVGMTWAPVGQTPVLKLSSSWNKLSLIGGITPAGELFEDRLEGSVKARDVVAFLRKVLSQVQGPVIAILDNARIHKAHVVKDLLASEPRLSLEHTPPYAPECNPIEWLWSWGKRTEITNLCPKSLGELHRGWDRVFTHLRHNKALIQSFFKASALRQC